MSLVEGKRHCFIILRDSLVTYLTDAKKNSEKINLRKKGLIFDSKFFKILFILAMELQKQKHKVKGYIMLTVRKQRAMNVVFNSLSLLCAVWDYSPWNVIAHIYRGSSNFNSPFWIIPHRHALKFVYMGILS